MGETMGLTALSVARSRACSDQVFLLADDFLYKKMNVHRKLLAPISHIG